MDYLILIPAQLGPALRDRRKRLGLTQHELGARVGLSQTVVSEMESDPSRSSVGKLFRFLSALELELVLRDKHAEAQEW